MAALAAFLLGLLQIKPTVDKMSALGAKIQSAGGPPQPEQLATMQRLTERLQALGRRDLVLILIASATMATARYW